MRIAFLTPEYVTETNSAGGLAHYLHRVARALMGRTHTVEIFTISDLDGTVEHDGVMVHRVRPESKWFFRLHRLLGRNMLITKGIILESWCLRRRFLERHRIAPFDIVQAPNYRASGLALSLSSPVPIVTRVSSHTRLWDEAYGLERTRDHKVREWLERLALRNSARRYAPSAFLARKLMQEQGFSVDVIRPLFFLEEQQLDYGVYDSALRGVEYLLFFGTIGRLKGVFVLADALADVLPRFQEMHVVLAGRSVADGCGRSSVELIAERLRPYEKRIHWLRALPHSQLYPVLQHARIVVLPSLVDNLPNTCMEAMAFGRVVVASKSVSFDELIDDAESGFLTEAGNPSALAAGITRAWSLSESERALIGERAEKRVAEFYPAIVLPELEHYYLATTADWSAHRTPMARWAMRVGSQRGARRCRGASDESGHRREVVGDARSDDYRNAHGSPR